MKFLFRKYCLITLSLVITGLLVPALTYGPGKYDLFYDSFILFLLFLIAKPIVNILMLPINILTLNLAQWLVNIILIYLWKFIVPEVKIGAWNFEGLNLGSINLSQISFSAWQTTIIVAVSLTLMMQFITWLFKH